MSLALTASFAHMFRRSAREARHTDSSEGNCRTASRTSSRAPLSTICRRRNVHRAHSRPTLSSSRVSSRQAIDARSDPRPSDPELPGTSIGAKLRMRIIGHFFNPNPLDEESPQQQPDACMHGCMSRCLPCGCSTGKKIEDGRGREVHPDHFRAIQEPSSHAPQQGPSQ